MSLEIDAHLSESGALYEGMLPVRSGLHLPAHSRLKREAPPARRPAVFLDRDGVIVRDVHYLRRTADIELLADVPSLKRLQERFYLIVATNQSGIARGFLTEDGLLEIHAAIAGQLESRGVTLDAFYYCPHLETADVSAYRKLCTCRKPAAGMLQQAAEDWAVPLRSSYLIGDSERDVAAGRAAGLAGSVLLGDRACNQRAWRKAASLEEAVDLILEAH